MKLEELHVGDSFTGFYVLKNVFLKVTNSGKPYLSCSLADASMMIEAKVWDYAGPIGPADEGKVAKVQGQMQEFKGAPQIKVDRIRLATENDPYDLADLVPVAPIDRQAAFLRLRSLVDGMEDSDYSAVCRVFLDRHGEALQKMPAAKSVHHSFVGGLLMHTVYMMELAQYLAGLYEKVIDRSLLLAGTLLHDIAKLQEFVVSDLGVVTEYSVKGQLLGHLVMGAQEAAQIAKELQIPEEKSILLQHMLLSHHGQPEFGAAVVPMCAEAELLSYIDNIDAKMEIYRENLEKTQPGTFSNRIFALEKRIYNHG
ncbi:MAG: HD domain-containing protein [Oscillospiraceae bacterium]|nr:HD domain-containing protein [Oscillospiraceae bacterium]